MAPELRRWTVANCNPVTYWISPVPELGLRFRCPKTSRISFFYYCPATGNYTAFAPLSGDGIKPSAFSSSLIANRDGVVKRSSLAEYRRGDEQQTVKHAALLFSM